MRELFEVVRERCTSAIWSRGVELVRTGAVSREREDADEIVLQVVTRGGMICPRVRLYPDDAEWDCDCPNRAEVCEHVAAAVIALRQAERSGAALPAAEAATGRIRYRLTREVGGLGLQRLALQRDGWKRMETTIASASSNPLGPEIAATQADLAVELALGPAHRGAIPPRLVRRALTALARCEDVRLDDEPVTVSDEPLLPRARLVDDGDGFRLLLDDVECDERFANGVARVGDVLRPVGEGRLTAAELRRLERGERFGTEDVARLVTEVLPGLQRRITVAVLSERLPRAVQATPRVAIEVGREGETLEVLPTLVYGDPPNARIDGGRLVHLQGAVPLRDERQERRLLARLRRELGLLPGVRVPFEGEEAVGFARRLERWRRTQRERDGEDSVRGDADRWFRETPALVPRVSTADGRFEVRFEPAAGGSGADGIAERAGRADPAAVLRAWRAGASMVPLVDGGWSPLPTDWLNRFGHRVADLLAARDASGELPRSAFADLARLCDELEQPPPPEVAALRAALVDFVGIPETPLPADLRAELRRYQRRGVDWLAFLRDARMGALLADDMGLGKTLQALCAMRGRTLVVAPTSVLPNWLEEAERFRPGLRCCRYHGPGRALDPQADLTVTTYAILRLDADALAAVEWHTVVLDEAQAIKNPDSQAAQAAFGLQAGFRAALTGTPVENRLDELWSQFHFLNRGLLGGRGDFDERYARPIALGEAGAAQRLRERVRPFVLRRLKQDVARELPPRTDVVLHCELSAVEREVYEAVRAATVRGVVARLREGGSVMAALEALLRLRQAACHPALVPGQHADTSSKVELLRESVETVVAEEHKALVFSQWTSMLDLVEPHLRAAGVGFVRLDGSTRDRAAVVRAFQDEAGPPVLLVSLKAGGTGLNLTAADHVFILDPWWNPAVEDQAADRAHRIGQDKPVMVYRLVAEETVEERILALQSRKRDLADAALGEGEAALGITRDDLLALLD